MVLYLLWVFTFSALSAKSRTLQGCLANDTVLAPGYNAQAELRQADAVHPQRLCLLFDTSLTRLLTD